MDQNQANYLDNTSSDISSDSSESLIIQQNKSSINKFSDTKLNIIDYDNNKNLFSEKLHKSGQKLANENYQNYNESEDKSIDEDDEPENNYFKLGQELPI